LRWADAPGNVLLNGQITGLPQDSVANVSQVVTLDRDALRDCTGKIPRAKLQLIFAGIDVILGR
jgi:mRNA interferase MazF